MSHILSKSGCLFHHDCPTTLELAAPIVLRAIGTKERRKERGDTHPGAYGESVTTGDGGASSGGGVHDVCQDTSSTRFAVAAMDRRMLENSKNASSCDYFLLPKPLPVLKEQGSNETMT